MVETYSEPCDAVVFLQTIEHVHDPDGVLENVRGMLRPGGMAFVSTPNVLTLAPKGAERSGNPWHLREYRAEEFRALAPRTSARSSSTGSSTRGRCARTSLRCAPAGIAYTPRCT